MTCYVIIVPSGNINLKVTSTTLWIVCGDQVLVPLEIKRLACVGLRGTRCSDEGHSQWHVGYSGCLNIGAAASNVPSELLRGLKDYTEVSCVRHCSKITPRLPKGWSVVHIVSTSPPRRRPRRRRTTRDETNFWNNHSTPFVRLSSNLIHRLTGT